MGATLRLTGVQTRRTLREPASAFFMIAFAPLLAVLLGLIFGNDPSPAFGGRGYLDANLVSFAAVVVAIVGFVLVPTDLVTQRQSGVLRRFRATPLRPASYITADVAVRFAISFAGVTAMILVGILAFGVQLDGSLPGVLLAVALGVLTFLAIGYTLAGLLPSAGVAQAVGNVAVYPLIMLSGSAVPKAILPEAVQNVAQFSPLTQFVDLLQGTSTGDALSELWVPLAVLGGLLVVATALAAKSFRWE